ncbi:ATP-grasp domain-containing protein [Membranihabitans marinus]|uniref:ATP-grasp domain-containing protein n=1 Tax=Membranihabitans marinus TaxID=1227546 RepID=UPI001EFFAE25|nr:ATP-grasp domain-containing protein [Membranihabitans marinus]
MDKIAILYQFQPAPQRQGLIKPMKPGGYADSGADIAFELIKNGWNIITPVDEPKVWKDSDWVFPDHREGIQDAIKKGSNILWLNTVLHSRHAILDNLHKDIRIIGHLPSLVDEYDNKWTTSQWLKSQNIPTPNSILIKEEDKNSEFDIRFPVVLKPILGRGSQGVLMVANAMALKEKLIEVFSSKRFGSSIYLEEFLTGQEITITVMPAGKYRYKSSTEYIEKPWCLPVVTRFNHHRGIAPYNGVVAVVQNSRLLDVSQQNTKEVQDAVICCEKVGHLLKIRAPIRIDCRADDTGKFYLFDINLKPNMTGPSREHRLNQDSLTSLAASGLGWTYTDLLENIIRQSWKI